MIKKYDSIIIGAGIAGLLTALRLSQRSQKVLVVEKDKVGSGATISNHGTIHSGAHYLEHHKSIVKNCKEAQYLFSNLFPKARVFSKNSIHIVEKKNFNRFEDLLKNNNFEHEVVAPNNIPELQQNILRSCKFINIKEGVYSSRKILETLLGFCLANGVNFVLGNRISKIVINSNKIKGIKLGLNEIILSDNVVIATGLGTSSILRSFNSHYSKYLKSRLGMMVYLPKTHVNRGFVFMMPAKPVLLPESGGGSLASIFGIPQPSISTELNFPINYAKAQFVIKEIENNFVSEVVNTEDAEFFVAGKTDYVNESSTAKNFVNPGYFIIDHDKFDKISGLYTIVTGKMTLAFHCTKDVSELVLGTPLPLKVEQRKMLNPEDNMLALEPWKGTS